MSSAQTPGWLLLIACATLLAGAAFVAGSPFKNQSPLDSEASASELSSSTSVYPEEPFVDKPPLPSYDKFDARKWKWADACRKKVGFSIQDSEWPSFLTYKAWDSCQGCLSAGGFAHSNGAYPADNSAESFQVIGDWMRISSLQQGSTSVLSTGNSREHWFNPPRTGTDDRALELEFYVYMDDSDFSKNPAALTRSSWSAMWAFGHGTGEFGWPTGGELDLLEWLPAFDPNTVLGATTGFHNAVSGAYPPCCLKPDGVTYPANADPGNFSFYYGPNSTRYVWPTGSKFATWGQSFNVADTGSRGDTLPADPKTRGNIMHIYARSTTTQFDVWVKPNADPAAPPAITNMTDPGVSFGYAHVFRAYGDFGSNADKTYADAFPDKVGQNARAPHRTATNWHQNMAFVWSIVRFPNPDADAKKLVFYLSDIHIRGGGNSTKAMAPPGTPTANISAATTMQDDVSPCGGWLSGGK